MNREISQIEEIELIAKFLGYEGQFEEWCGGNILVDDIFSETGRSMIPFEPNKDWNYLMKAVEKIEKHGCIVEIWLSGGKGCRITKILSKTKSWTAPVESNSTIEAVYTAVVEFIKYHNSLTPPTNE